MAHLNLDQLKFYIVQFHDGTYFRSIGYGGYGPNKVKEVNKARVYQKPGQAKSVVTKFAQYYPNEGLAVILELSVGKVTVLDQTDRVEKALLKKKQKVEKAKAKHAKWELIEARAALQQAEQKIGIIKKKLDSSDKV